METIQKNKQTRIIVLTVLVLSILTFGISYAYFAMMAANTTTELTAVSELTLAYEDDNLYTINGLIPSSRENAIKGASNASRNGICKDSNNHVVCSLYEFTVSNTATVSQDITINLTPIINQYENLNFIVYKAENTGITTSLSALMDYSLTKDSIESIELNSLSITLEKGTDVTYTIVFYINNLNQEQSELDAGKNFTAGINVLSVTTGSFVSGNFGNGCWETTQIDSTNNYTLTAFNGIQPDGTIVSACSSFVSDAIEGDDHHYTVNIPSSYGGKQITIIGNGLLSPGYQYGLLTNTVDPNNTNGTDPNNTNGTDPNNTSFENGLFPPMVTNYLNIRNINIAEGITEIGDEAFYGTPISSISIPSTVIKIGRTSFADSELETVNFMKDIDGNSSLKYIEKESFSGLYLSTITIPSSVIYIKSDAFEHNKNLTEILFEGTNSSITTVEYCAFCYCNLTYTSEEPLILPSSLTYVGGMAFAGNPNLLAIKPMALDISGYASDWIGTNTSILTNN